MKLISYVLDGNEHWGAIAGEDRVVPGAAILEGCATLKDALSRAPLPAIADAAAEAQATLPLASLTLLPVIPNPTHFFSAGLNYRDHIEETAHDAPVNPRFHSRVSTSLAGHGGPVVRPRVSTIFDFEGELAVIIGKHGRHISEMDALAHIAGYTCFMDGSVRDYQQHSVTSGKNFFRTGALGPWMVPADAFTHPLELNLTTRLNGEVVQKSNTRLMIYSIARMISYLSDIVPLEPGDVIATGTPEGVGYRRTPPLLLTPGDAIEVEIDGIGCLRNTVDDEEPAERQAR